MGRIRSKNTIPEKIVRSLLHRMGYRFRLHKKDLPGKPDIVLTKYRTVFFVHGCFWHRHKSCKDASMPKSNIPFWKKKFKSNMDRDKTKTKQLKSRGWKVYVIWACELKNKDKLKRKIKKILSKVNIV